MNNLGRRTSITPHLLHICLIISVVSCFVIPLEASFNDCATNWSNFANPGFIAGYTYKGQIIKDTQSGGTGGDPTHGQANVPPSQTDLASGVTGGVNPGRYATPFFGYYDGGTAYSPDSPSTMLDDFIFFRMRVSADPSKSEGFDNYHWNILLDVDGDGYKEFWVDLEGKYAANDYDRLNILYDNSNRQDIPNPDAAGVRVDFFRAYNQQDGAEAGDPACPPGSSGRSHTRVVPTNDGTGNYWIEFQIPMTAFKDSYGNQVLFPDSPVAFVFSTGASANDPLQKDWMMDLNFLTLVDPITFGDIVYPNGKPMIRFTDSAMNFVNFYTVGDMVYVYVADPFANTSSPDAIQVTVSDSVTGDNETITLIETAPDSGIFTNTGTGLPTSGSDGIFGNSDGSGSLEVASGDTIYVSYTNPNYQTATDGAAIIGACEAFIEFTRANGLPTVNFILTNNVSTSDKMYVTVTDFSANTDPGTRQTISVSLSGRDSQNITLLETGNNTGVFRNTAGLDTKIFDGSAAPNDGLWEDVDGGTVTVTYYYSCGGNPHTRTATASIFVTPEAGRIYFTNQAGTQNVELYTSGMPVYMKVVDATYTCAGPLTVTVASSAGDSETLTITETSPGSGVYMNGSPLTTATYSGSNIPNDGILTASDGDTLTATYHDCNDGDGFAGNDDKTDTASFNTPSVLINEVLFWPDSLTCAGEYIQLYNTSNLPVDVTGYRLVNKRGFAYTVPQYNGSSILLGAGQSIYISISGQPPFDVYDPNTGNYYLFAQAGDATEYPADELGDPGYASAEDRNDLISLYDSSNVIVDFVSWSANTNPSVEFLSGFYAAVSANIWQDGAFVNVSGMMEGQGISRVSAGYDTDAPSDWTIVDTPGGVCQYIVTHAVVSSFTAGVEGGRMTVQWETASEVGTAGFYLLRLDSVSGGYRQLNGMLLPGVFNSPQGGKYRLIDNGASLTEANTYVLVEVESSGTQRAFGPFTFDRKGTRIEAPYGQASSTLLSGEPLIVEESVSNYTREGRRVRVAVEEGNDKGTTQKAVQALRGDEPAELLIREKGLYHLRLEDISGVLGLTARTVRNMIKNGWLSITNQGQKVAYLPAEDGSGLYFYGEAIDSIYTEDNVYWLKRDRGLRMEVIEGKGPSPSAGEESFSESLHFEEDRLDAPALTFDPSADYWFWDYIVSGYPDMDTKTFTFRVNGASFTESASLSISLKGATDTAFSPEHHAVFKINGTYLGESFWRGTGSHEVLLSFSPLLLKEGDNTVEITGLLDTGAPYSIFFVNSFDLNYQRLYTAIGNRLFFRAGTHQVVTVGGFTNPDIMLFEVADFRNPRLIKATTIDVGAGGYRVSFVPSSPDALYLALTGDAVASPQAIRRNASSSGLKTKSVGADYIIITTPELKGTAQSLSAHRQTRGMTAKVVTLNDIMNEFNYGIYDPGAIRDFLSYSHTNWIKRPRYVVLAGDGTYDYKNRLGFGGNLVPPMMVATPHGLFPSDNFYADVNGDGLPEMAVGRLPAKSASELQGVIQKIITYENGKGGAWEKKVLLLADSPGEGVDFPLESDEVAYLVPSKYSQVKIYMPEHPLNEARWLLMNAINSGASFMNFIGHAGVDRLTREGLLVTDDVASMTNGQALPIVTAMTCVMAQFALPGYDSLAEALVMKKNGGAIAVWAPTGLSIDREAAILDKAFFTGVFKDGGQVVGDAILKSLETLKGKRGEAYMTGIYTLLGDPALRIRGVETK